MKHTYHEGTEALERFKRGMTKLFQVRKEAVIIANLKPKRKQIKSGKG